MRVSKVVIDVSNLRVGGAVQVAASFVDELEALKTDPATLVAHPWLDAVRIEVSPEVARNVIISSARREVESRRWHHVRCWIPVGHDRRFDASFTLFGPEYGSRRARRRIVGFADGLAVLPIPKHVKALWGARIIRMAIRNWISRALHARADRIVVESPSLSRHLVSRARIPQSKITVVPNAINTVFYEKTNWEPIPDFSDRLGSAFSICYPARAYPHKNHEYLGQVWRKLASTGVHVKFVVTLTRDEWLNSSPLFKRACINVGPLRIGQMPSLYAASDAVIFPSFLESFSVTPIEAISANGLLFASDRDFVSEIVMDGALYFEPTSVGSCAKLIAETLPDNALIEMQRERARRVVAGLPSARDRARAYLEVISRELEWL